MGLLQELGASFDVGPIPEDLQEQAEEWHEKLIEDACEVDDDAMEAYLEGNVSHVLYPLPCTAPVSLYASGKVHQFVASVAAQDSYQGQGKLEQMLNGK